MYIHWALDLLLSYFQILNYLNSNKKLDDLSKKKDVHSSSHIISFSWIFEFIINYVYLYERNLRIFIMNFILFYLDYSNSVKKLVVLSEKKLHTFILTYSFFYLDFQI